MSDKPVSKTLEGLGRALGSGRTARAERQARETLAASLQRERQKVALLKAKVEAARRQLETARSAADRAPIHPDAGRYLACSRKDGLGARLLNLIWSWRMARKIDARLLVFWPPMPSQYGEGLTAGDVFDVFKLAAPPLRDQIQIVDGRSNHYVHEKSVNLDVFRWCDPEPFARTLPLGPGEVLPIIRSFSRPPLIEGEVLQDALKDAQALFATLPIRDNIERALERATNGRDLGRTVAIHVRRGDIVETLKASCAELAAGPAEAGSVFERYTTNFFRLCVPLQAYVRPVEASVREGCDVILFTDTPELSDHFRGIFGDRLTLARELSPAGLSEQQRAFFELLLMGRCRQVVGSRSAFGQAAAVTGGAEFIDARSRSSAEEMIGAYVDIVEFHRQEPRVKAAMSAALHRSLGKRDLGFRAWRVTEDELVALLEAARPAAAEQPVR